MPDNRTYTDRAEYLKEAVAKRRRTVREKIVLYKGGKCTICGYDKCTNALDLHHVNASQKDFGISSGGLTRAWSKVVAEADKCVLVCANCHREIHAGIIEVQPLIVMSE
jgi:5-methylcytosine-specific restriction endonuclease McrA